MFHVSKQETGKILQPFRKLWFFANLCYEGYRNSDEVQSKDCHLDQCQSGRISVQDVTRKARASGVDDKLFLDRYAAAVTLNGEVVNAANATTQGFGIWRMTEVQFSSIITRKSRTDQSHISDDLVSNVNVCYRCF